MSRFFAAGGYSTGSMTDNSLDACLKLVADGYRRRTIESVRNTDDHEMTVVELVETLHGTEPITVSGGTPDPRQLHIELVHTHLPKLAEHDVVEYDPKDDVVRYRPDARIERLLDSIPEALARPNL